MKTLSLTLSSLLLAMALLLGREAAAIDSAFLQDINLARAKGCDRRAGIKVGFVADPKLDQAAGRLAAGAKLSAALGQSKYRAISSASVRLGGYESDAEVVDALTTRFCAHLLSPDFGAIGTAKRGDAIWLVFASAFTPPPEKDAQAVASQALVLVNRARATARLCGRKQFPAVGALQLEPKLSIAARAHSVDMATQNYFEHHGLDGSTVADRVSRAGYRWSTVGENIAAGPTSVAATIQLWLDSPGHCANLMSPAFEQMGIAFAVDTDSQAGIYWTQVFASPK